jgi:hypothetical protein
MDNKVSKISCYISYCYDDMDWVTLNFVIGEIKEKSGGKIDFLFDKDRLKVGRSINRFIEQIEKSHSVILILTPKYKEKVLERKPSGVYSEYSKIIEKFNKNNEKIKARIRSEKKDDPDYVGTFKLIPILFSGDKSKSIPDELLNEIFIDLKNLRVQERPEHKGIKPPSNYKLVYESKIDEIASELQLFQATVSPKFLSTYNDYFNRFLINTKEYIVDPYLLKHIDQIWVKTHYYQKIAKQETFLLVGRKGCGKTLIGIAMELLNDGEYLTHVQIHFDKHNLHSLFSFTDNQKIRSDVKHIFPMYVLYQFAWETFIYLSIFFAISKNIDKSKLLPPQKATINQIASLKKRMLVSLDEQNQQYELLVYCFNAIPGFIEHCISKARPSEEMFLPDLDGLCNCYEFINFTLGKVRNKYAFTLILDFFKSNPDFKVLVSADGIDYAFNKFRTESLKAKEDLNERALFEKAWLDGLLRTGLNIKNSKSALLEFGKTIDFCLTIPEDRFIEILVTERDSIEYQGFQYMNWSAIELAILVRKRLELINEIRVEKDTPEKMLDKIMNLKYKYIPNEIETELNGQKYRMPLFGYVLRHTCWRPREVLLYYANLISACELLKKNGYEITSKTVSAKINRMTSRIVRQEYLNEFNAVITNIDFILKRFTGKNQILDYMELKSSLDQISVDWAIKLSQPMTIVEKFKVLYRTGFIGLYISDETVLKEMSLLNKHVFVFNEGDDFLESLTEENMKKNKFIIHPMFVQYLNLHTSELVLSLQWEYLHENEVVRF